MDEVRFWEEEGSLLPDLISGRINKPNLRIRVSGAILKDGTGVVGFSFVEGHRFALTQARINTSPGQETDAQGWGGGFAVEEAGRWVDVKWTAEALGNRPLPAQLIAPAVEYLNRRRAELMSE